MLLFLLACTQSPIDSTPDTSPPPPGTLALTFGIDSDYLAMMQEPAAGTFYGTFWRGDEVMGFGPIAGAEELSDFQVILDLQDGGPSEVLFESPELPAIEVVVLGFLDSDANSTSEDREPDAKDPVTLPGDNDFDVLSGQRTEVQVFFGLLNP